MAKSCLGVGLLVIAPEAAAWKVPEWMEVLEVSNFKVKPSQMIGDLVGKPFGESEITIRVDPDLDQSLEEVQNILSKTAEVGVAEAATIVAMIKNNQFNQEDMKNVLGKQGMKSALFQNADIDLGTTDSPGLPSRMSDFDPSKNPGDNFVYPLNDIFYVPLDVDPRDEAYVTGFRSDRAIPAGDKLAADNIADYHKLIVTIMKEQEAMGGVAGKLDHMCLLIPLAKREQAKRLDAWLMKNEKGYEPLFSGDAESEACKTDTKRSLFWVEGLTAWALRTDTQTIFGPLMMGPAAGEKYDKAGDVLYNLSDVHAQAFTGEMKERKISVAQGEFVSVMGFGPATVMTKRLLETLESTLTRSPQALAVTSLAWEGAELSMPGFGIFMPFFNFAPGKLNAFMTKYHSGAFFDKYIDGAASRDGKYIWTIGLRFEFKEVMKFSILPTGPSGEDEIWIIPMNSKSKYSKSKQIEKQLKGAHFDLKNGGTLITAADKVDMIGRSASK